MCAKVQLYVETTKDFLLFLLKTSLSFFTFKEGSTSLTKPLSCQKREDVTALLSSEPLRSKVGGPSKVCARLCGLGPPGVGVGGDSEGQDVPGGPSFLASAR